jgi:hypothetical protein
MDLLDFVLEEGQVRLSENVNNLSTAEDITKAVGSGFANREVDLKNGIVPLSFLQKPLVRSKEEDFARLKRLLPHP